MDDDWDLHAVVRSCSTAVTTTNVTFPAPDDQNSPFDFHGFEDDRNDTVSFHNIYQEFCLNDDPPPPAAVMPVPAGHVMAQMKPPLQIQENVQLINNPQRFPAATIPQPVRPRRRKNQQMKMVRQMTQEELSADSWAWRKYGQKPIKGSPYPRNYYRCSTSKGCAARKQVERSPNDPGIFVVSYTGEHTHPRPTHRSTLAGSIRSKSAIAVKNNGLLYHKNSASSSSPSASSFSPATPSAAQNADVEMADEEDVAGDEDSENATLQNDDDDVFRGFQDSDQSSGGGDFFPLSSPAWSPAGNTAAFGGG